MKETKLILTTVKAPKFSLIPDNGIFWLLEHYVTWYFSYYNIIIGNKISE